MAFLPDHAFQLIQRAHSNGRMAHAFLIYGPSGDDVRSLAVRLTCLVNGWTGPETIDDVRQRGVHVIEPESKSRIIRVLQMRALEDELHMTSLGMDTKVAIICDCDRMREEAANAFLKTLEEPPDNTLILLLTSQPDVLLSTIRSRCVRVPLYASEEGGVKLDDEQRRIVEMVAAHFSGGELNPSRALGLLQSFQSLLTSVKSRISDEHDEALDEETKIYAQRTDGVWLKDREDYYDNLTESQYQEQRNRLLSLLYIWFGEILRRQQGLDALSLPDFAAVTARVAETMPQRDLHRRLKAVEELRSNLATTVREPLALEVAFLKAFG